MKRLTTTTTYVDGDGQRRVKLVNDPPIVINPRTIIHGIGYLFVALGIVCFFAAWAAVDYSFATGAVWALLTHDGQGFNTYVVWGCITNTVICVILATIALNIESEKE